MPLTRFIVQRSSRAAVVAALLTLPILAWCRPSLARESAAARLFEEGRALLVAGRLREACSKLEESQRLEPRLGTLLNVAFCQERLGRLATAWMQFREAASWARRRADPERERFAQAHLDALEPRVPTLQVRTAAGEEDAPALLLDGGALSPADAREALRLDPGEHVLVATRDGTEYWRTRVTLRESEHATVGIPAPPAAALGRDRAATSGNEEAAAHGAGRFVYELGAFIAYLELDPVDATAADSPPDVRVSVDGQTASCETRRCDYLMLGSSSGFVAGVAGFVGYALTADVDLGLRLLLGPRAGGGALVALGPALSWSIAERYELSPAVLFGTASGTGEGVARLQAPENVYDFDTRASASLGFAMGLGAELGLKLGESATGAVVLQATPLFLYGSNGLAWSLPLGAVFRWN